MKTVPTATDTNMDISTGITMDTRMPSLAMNMIIVGPTAMTITRKASTTGAMLATTPGYREASEGHRHHRHGGYYPGSSG